MYLPNDEFDYVFLKNHLKAYAQPRRQIHELMKKKHIIRIKKGLYIPNENHHAMVSELHLANLIYGPSYVSFESALSYYGLIPEAVKNIQSATFKRRKTFDTYLGRFIYVVVPKDQYTYGLCFSTVNGKSILMASVQKALWDMMWRDRFQIANVNEYLKSDLRVKQGFKRLFFKFALRMKSVRLDKSMKNLIAQMT